MRSRRSLQIWIPYWHKPIVRKPNDKTARDNWYGSHDHFACSSGIMAISHRGYLRFDFSGAGRNLSSYIRERVKTQSWDTPTLEPAVPDRSGDLRILDFSCGSILDW